MINIKTELEKNQILLSIFSAEFYNKSVVNLLKNLENEKICYVTLNKTANSLMNNLKFNGINTKNIFFIDAISKSIDKSKELSNGILISSPYAFTELSIAINEVLKSKAFNLVIFDSLSSLKVYSNENIAIRFTSGIINKIRSKEDRGIFTCLEGDIKTNLIKQSSMYVDKVLNFEPWYGELRKDRIKKIGGPLTFIVALLAVLSFLNTGSDNITGLITSPVAGEPVIMPFLFFIVVIAAVLVTFYRKEIMLKVHDLKNVNKPMKISNKDKLRTRFRNMIYKWLNRLD